MKVLFALAAAVLCLGPGAPPAPAPGPDRRSSPPAAEKPAESRHDRERAAEPLYAAAVSAAGGPDADESRVLDAIEAALRAGACPTRALTEEAFQRFRTNQRFRFAIRDHAHQAEIRMVTDTEPGTPLVVSGTVIGHNSEPVAGALVYVFHTDAAGHYTRGGMDESNPRLFGYMKTDERGRFSFRTIRPGPYPDEVEPVEEHIHGEISAAGHRARTVRIGFADDPFWQRQSRRPPGWAVPVSRRDDGVLACSVEVKLEAPPAAAPGPVIP